MAQDLGVPKAEVAQHASAVRCDREYVRMVFRTIARDTDERTLIFSLLPLAWFNSVPVDWLARQMIQINSSQTYLYRLPMPQPWDDEIRCNPDFAQLAKNILLLSLAASWDDFAELAPLFDVQRKDLPTTAKAQDTLRVQNDKLVAKLYGITDAELAHLLRSFKVMAGKRAEYLTLLA